MNALSRVICATGLVIATCLDVVAFGQSQIVEQEGSFITLADGTIVQVNPYGLDSLETNSWRYGDDLFTPDSYPETGTDYRQRIVNKRTGKAVNGRTLYTPQFIGNVQVDPLAVAEANLAAQIVQLQIANQQAAEIEAAIQRTTPHPLPQQAKPATRKPRHASRAKEAREARENEYLPYDLRPEFLERYARERVRQGTDNPIVPPVEIPEENLPSRFHRRNSIPRYVYPGSRR